MRIRLLAVQSLDGFITRHSVPGSAFASAGDQAHYQRTLAGCDCSIMGAATYRVSRELIRRNPGRTQLRIVLTRTPARFAADAVPGVLEFSAAAPAALAAALRQRGCRECALLGGSRINSLFLAADLVDELWVTIEPRLFGGGVPLLAQQTDQALRLLATEPLGGGTLLVTYGLPHRGPS
jgi:riboflavin biosynthesis pyrimidine reductase